MRALRHQIRAFALRVRAFEVRVRSPEAGTRTFGVSTGPFGVLSCTFEEQSCAFEDLFAERRAPGTGIDHFSLEAVSSGWEMPHCDVSARCRRGPAAR
jgi:hypothetical protein